MAVVSGLAPVDDKGTALFYEDTGKPGQSDSYVTLILCHGAIFYGGFRRMFPYAAEHNLRIVAVTMRDYPGSTPYSAEELALLRGSKEEQAPMIRARGHELASFIEWFVRNKNIPPLSESPKGRSGGAAVLGWSWGNCMTLSLFGNASTLPEPRREFLKQYMRTSFIFDPPSFALGVLHPTVEEVQHPLFDPDISVADKPKQFIAWAASYFAHSSAVLNNLANLERGELFSGISSTPLDDPPPTTASITAEELTEITDPSVYERSHVLMEDVDREVYLDNAWNALVSSDRAWPSVRSVYIWCDRSVGTTVYTAWHLLKLLEGPWSGNGRSVEVVRMEGANHIPFWDEPKHIVEFLVDLI